MENIRTKNEKGKEHGYQEWYVDNDILWYRGNYKNGLEIGYTEINIGEGGVGDEDTDILYYIK